MTQTAGIPWQTTGQLYNTPPHFIREVQGGGRPQNETTKYLKTPLVQRDVAKKEGSAHRPIPPTVALRPTSSTTLSKPSIYKTKLIQTNYMYMDSTGDKSG
jgi:hypothetical protein